MVFDLSRGRGWEGAAGEELYLRLRYRSSTAGRLQVFYRFGGQPFREELSRSLDIVRTAEHGEPEVAVAPIGPPAAASRRLTDIRFDIPRDSLFEVVDAEILRRPAGYQEYLVRILDQRDAALDDIGDEKTRYTTRRMLIDERLDAYVIGLRQNEFKVEIFEDNLNRLAQQEADWYAKKAETDAVPPEKVREQIEKLRQ